MRTLTVFGTGQNITSLDQVVEDFDYGYSFCNVKVYNREKVMMAQADPDRGVNAIAAFNTIWAEMQQKIDLPQGYTMKYFGDQESQVESNEAIGANLPLAFFLMFITLLLLFKTYRKSTIILMMLPLICIGVVFGRVELGIQFDFFALLGVRGIIGMNINTAVLCVDQFEFGAIGAH